MQEAVMVDVTGAKIQVPEQLADLPMQVTNTCNQIEDLLIALNSQLVALEAFWQGTASSGHMTVQQQWHTAENNLLTGVGVLGGVARTTQANWQNYVDGETANTNSWAQ
jgi:uncharacterized protein YukE